MHSTALWLMQGGLSVLLLLLTASTAWAVEHERPSKLIFDTDMGNDIDDALALGVIHALESRRECELLAVTLSKDNAFSGPFVDLVNTFYGRGDIPIGVVRDGKTPADSKYTTPLCQARDGNEQRYPHDLIDGADAPEAVEVLRGVLAKQPDGKHRYLTVDPGQIVRVREALIQLASQPP